MLRVGEKVGERTEGEASRWVERQTLKRMDQQSVSQTDRHRQIDRDRDAGKEGRKKERVFKVGS